MFVHYLVSSIFLLTVMNANAFSNQDLVQFGESAPVHISESSSSSVANKNFWDNIYQNSILNTKTKYNTLSGEKVCFTCPIDRDTFQSLFHQAELASGTPGEVPPRTTIAWTTQLSGNRMIFFCRNNTRMSNLPIYLGNDKDESADGGELDYSCENDRLCLRNLRHNYPENYQCLIKSYVLNVKLNVIVQLQYVILYFSGDSVKFAYEKEVQVYENHLFTVKCEVPETNPVSNVNAYIDGKELKLTKLEKKTIDNRMSINTYSFDINATREMNGKSVKCEASMKDIPTELASSIDLRSYISKDYTLSVYYLPTCVYPTRTYKTGINRSIVIECPIEASNPEVTSYKMIPPSSRTQYSMLDNTQELSKIGRFRINPSSRHDFGLYECIPRSLAGTAKCDINIELGATPDPPQDCTVQFNNMNNKTYAQFTCKPGFNQGGTTSFLTIYEINLNDDSLKLSGRVNIDGSYTNQEVPFITPTDSNEYYEFLIMQENNYGNSTAVKLTLGVSNMAKKTDWVEDKKMVMVGGAAGLIVFLVFICCCCCLTDMFSMGKTDNPCCKCCGSDSHDDDGSTYKKAPLDGDANSTLINQPFQGFNSQTKMDHQSNYEYYDNTSTGLLTETYSQRNAYLNKKPNRLLKKSSSYEGSQDEDNYSQDDDEETEQEHYMNNKTHKKSDKNDYNDSSEETTSASGSGSEHKSLSDHPGYVTSKMNVPKKIVYSANNGIMENYTRNLKANQGYNVNNYSTIDSKKFIKTDNGLVYTPLNGGILKKSTDALMNEDDRHLDSKYHLEEDAYEDLRISRNYNKIASTYSNVKKSTPLTNKELFGGPPIPQDTFKNELDLKLKSFNNSTNEFKQYQIEQSSTATTSLSSASSCTSNSDLVKDNNLQATKGRNGPAPLASNLTESLTSNGNSNGSSGSHYSLLKTTLNVKGASEALENSLAMQALRKSQTKISTSNCATKPPIIKPKPKATSNPYYTNPKVKQTFPTENTVHNQSGENLISNFKETSLSASPSTSVTDVSSNNLTPQHNNNNLADEISSAHINNLVKQRNSYQHAVNSNTIHKATTTFGTNPVSDGMIYSTTKINGNANGDLIRTTYESTTLNRKAAYQPSIDEEIIAKKAGTSFTSARTLERKHIQNSEC